MTSAVRTAIFPVGGLGTRFLPATKAMPKEMLPVVDRPLIQYAVEEARSAGIEQFIFVTGRGKSAIEDHFDHSYELNEMLRARRKHEVLAELEAFIPSPGAVSYTRQREPLGLGHAVWCARKMVGDEPVAVLLADDLIKAETPCLKQMIAAYDRDLGSMVAVMPVDLSTSASYGIVAPALGKQEQQVFSLAGMVEKPTPELAPSNLAIIGRYILHPQVFVQLDMMVMRQERGAGGEIQLTDALAQMIDPEMPGVAGFRFLGQRFDCGDKLGFIQANLAFALDHPEIGVHMPRLLDQFQRDLRRQPKEESEKTLYVDGHKGEA